MKKIYTLLALSLTLQAQTFQEVIDYSIQNNYQLQILEEESLIVSEQKEIETLWDDPILKAGINDLQSDKPFSRNVEAMQNQFVALSQTIPLSNKLEVASQIEEEKLKLIEEKKEALKVNIAFGIRKAFIAAANSKRTLTILDDYIGFLNTPMDLLINLSAVERNSVDKYIKTQLLQKSYELQRQNALQRRSIAIEQIELIGNLKLDTFSDEVTSQNLHEQSIEMLLVQIAEQSPELGMAIVLKDVASKGVELARQKEQADITVTGGYYQRFDRNDYVSFSVAYPLYTHGKQEKQKVQAMKRVNIQNLTYNKTKVQLEQGLKISLHELQALHQELGILEESRKKILKLIANAKSELSIGGSLVRYYELFSKKTENALAMNKKRFAILEIENQIRQLLGER
ncbi:MAG: Heavy metal RND efflux outer membrane protein, CzcC family [uncultured Sulfurovum sp.]|uniref:Heavy metal RND efflux outer membrane protein, CzcC family n=1 Tax=uncultured Sulfurovum sp. TaxID=269237 RepID=A0A6S6SDF8_9BACT|nr:MAG: Heavy metal RND efflux outer membrane protein, CzcC family [uncultured Sulfurovum sp.]